MKICLFLFVFCLLANAGGSPLKGEEFYYEISGRTHVETVVFIHGLGTSGESFRPLVEPLSRNFRVVLYDQRGHGRTPAKGDCYTSECMADDLEVLRKHLGLKRFHLVGHSLGARTAVAYLGKYPRNVKSVVVEDMEMIPRNIPTEKQKKENIQKAIELRNQFRSFTFPNQEALKAKLAPLYGSNTEALKTVLEKRTVTYPDGSVILAFRPHVALLYGFQSNADDLAEIVRDTKISVLFLLGEVGKGSAVSKEGLEQILRFPQATSIRVVGAGHVVHQDATEATVDLITQFIQSTTIPEKLIAKWGTRESVKEKRDIASLHDIAYQTKLMRMGKASVDIPVPLQKKFSDISATGLEGIPEEVIQSELFPRGSAFATPAGRLTSLGIEFLVHGVVFSVSKRGLFYDPTEKGIQNAIRNAAEIAKSRGYHELAIPFDPNPAFLSRMGVEKDELLLSILKGITKLKGSIETRLVFSNAPELSLFWEKVREFSVKYEKAKVKPVLGSLADFSRHGCPVVLNWAAMEGPVTGDLSRALLNHTGSLQEGEERAKSLARSLSANLLPLMR